MQTTFCGRKQLSCNNLHDHFRVSYRLRDEKVAGSNPVTPIQQKSPGNVDSNTLPGHAEKYSNPSPTPIKAPANTQPTRPRSEYRMGRPSPDYIPQMRKTKGKFARVTLNGKEHRLGPWGSDEAREKYDLLIQTWLGSGRDLGASRVTSITSVADLADAYLAWCGKTFQKAGSLTSTYSTTERALSLLYSSGQSLCHRQEFGPKHLSEFRKWLAINGVTYVSKRRTEDGKPAVGKLTRGTINRYVQVVVAMFKWAVSEQLVSEVSYLALKTLPPTRRRRPIPGAGVVVREHIPVHGVSKEIIDRTCKHLSPTVAAMVRLQLASGMRPNEVCGLRGRFLKSTDTKGVMAYSVPFEHSKLDHMEIDRVVYLGPKAMKIIKPLLLDDPDQYIFSPRRVRLAQDAERRRNRTLPMWDSHDPDLRADRRAAKSRRSGAGGRMPGEHYTTTSYARAISRACEAAQLKASEFWSPNQLRHNAATEFANATKIEVAQSLLGHRDIKTTMRYVKVKEQKAAAAAKRLA